MSRERDQDRSIDACLGHRVQKLLGGCGEIGREEVVDVAREAVGDRREHVGVRVDDHHRPSRKRRAARA